MPEEIKKKLEELDIEVTIIEGQPKRYVAEGSITRALRLIKEILEELA